MRCSVCKEEYPSRFYFKTETLCLKCYRRQHPDDTNIRFLEVSQREIAGKPLRCPHCDFNEFRFRETLMNTRGLTFLGLEWANKEASNYICGRCGYVLWFMPEENSEA